MRSPIQSINVFLRTLSFAVWSIIINGWINTYHKTSIMFTKHWLFEVVKDTWLHYYRGHQLLSKPYKLWTKNDKNDHWGFNTVYSGNQYIRYFQKTTSAVLLYEFFKKFFVNDGVSIFDAFSIYIYFDWTKIFLKIMTLPPMYTMDLYSRSTYLSCFSGIMRFRFRKFWTLLVRWNSTLSE